MKNLLTIIAFAFVMLFGVQNTSAQNLTQNQDRPEVVAKAQAAKLTKELNLNGDQQRTIFRALVIKESNYRKQVNGKDLNNDNVATAKKKIDATFNDVLMKNLSKEQYSAWLKRQ